MSSKHAFASNATRKNILLALAVCVLGVVINLLGAPLGERLPFPLFLDCIGTILSAALAGYIPGIAVGFLTNLIRGFTDISSAYYGVLNVLIAVGAAFFSQKGFFKKLWKLVFPVLLFAFIGGGLGFLLTWFLYGKTFSVGISAPLAHSLYDGGFPSVFLSQLTADLLIDLADKAVSVAIAAAVLALLPASVKDALNFYGWRNASFHNRKEKTARLVSLRAKVMFIISVTAIVVAVVITVISFRQFHDAAIENQISFGYGVANLSASYIDGDRVEEFIKSGGASEEYRQVEEKMSAIMNSSPDIEYVYAYQILPDGCHVVFDPDTADMPGEDPGTVIPFDDAFTPYLPALLSGKAIEPVISNETYGWLLTIYQPVYDSEGVCRCYAAVDLSMPRIVSNEQMLLVRIISLFLSFFILLLASGLFLAQRQIIVPINSIAEAASAFAYNNEEARAETLDRIQSLDIRTGDEIENLYLSFVKTTDDTVRYITEAQEHNEKIAKLQNGLIMLLADMVESRDQCTGDHVRKTAAYARLIMEQMRREDIYTDQLTDDFVQDVINSAPLHDLGKIQIPDSLLNKPGKLTDEEFAQMKTHTTMGGKIIMNAITAISENDSGYLKEAKNLANYHHERWDGRGYPRGLAGEDIPLSARIMAVADVFDALVSKRSYKNSFPFEKAMGIIREESGTHFDPLVAKAFLDAEDEVRRVAESHQEKYI